MRVMFQSFVGPASLAAASLASPGEKLRGLGPEEDEEGLVHVDVFPPIFLPVPGNDGLDGGFHVLALAPPHQGYEHAADKGIFPVPSDNLTVSRELPGIDDARCPNERNACIPSRDDPV